MGELLRPRVCWGGQAKHSSREQQVKANVPCPKQGLRYTPA